MEFPESERDAEAAAPTRQISALLGSTCWHISPQARAAVRAVLDLAREGGR